MIAIPASALGWARGASNDANVQAGMLACWYFESGFDPTAQGDYTTTGGPPWYTKDTAPPGAWPTSFGLGQLHTTGGLGDGHSPADLLNPSTNAAICAASIHTALASTGSLYDALAPWSTRPSAYPLAVEILSSGALGGGSAPPPGAPTSPPGGTADHSNLIPFAVAAVVIGIVLS